MPSLSVAIMARDAAAHLPALLAEARAYADEIIVGVDVASADGTWEVARAGADRLFGFSHGGIASPARMACLERASCDWTLFLDDDEGMDDAFPALRDDLLGATELTHWWLPRKWLDGHDPSLFLKASPWWPDFSLRLVRTDPSRVWKPLAIHTGIQAMGRGGWEPRTSIIHFDRVVRDADARAAKLERWRARGQTAAAERFYEQVVSVPRAPVVPAPLRRPVPPGAALVRDHRSAARVDAQTDDLDRRPRTPGWGAAVAVHMPRSARPGEVLAADAVARNTGTLRWDSLTREAWPALGLAYRLTTAGGEVLPDAAMRTPIAQDVGPGEELHLLAVLVAPDAPGDYVLRWQLVSEHEHWFEDLGSAAALCPLTVR